MSWFGGASQPGKRQTASPTASLESVTMLVARGIAPVHAIIEQLTTSECRLRSVALLHNDDPVEFEFAMFDSKAKVRGRVVARAQKGPRFLYNVRLVGMSSAEIDELARVLMLVHRRGAMNRSLERVQAQLPTTDGLTRKNLRVPSQFAILYRTAKEHFKPAQAANISAGGLSMACGDALVEGMPIELKMTLPTDVLRVFPEETEVLDMRTRAVQQSSRSGMRRDFNEMLLRARVVSHQPIAPGLYSYGVEFWQVDAATREEIARYVHAVQLAKRHEK